MSDKKTTTTWRDALRADEGFVLADRGTRDTINFDGDKTEGKERLEELADPVSDLQERLFAQAQYGASDRVLLVVQGMDTAGKGGIMRHVVGNVDPQGVAITAFKSPTKEELAHDFLWRIRKALPAAGEIGVFDRSHYEDVLIVRVHDLVPESEWSQRYDIINDFEREVTDAGTRIIKVMLHISKEEQRERLAERLDRPDKHWKYNPRDIDERKLWPSYHEAYQAIMDKTSTDVAPWYVVPADRKWYARLAVMNLLHETLLDIDPQWPVAEFDVEAEMKQLAAS